MTKHAHSTVADRYATMTPAEWRLHLVARGFHIFPLTPGTKEPMPGSRGFHDASNDPHRATAGWPSEDHGVGIATGASGLFVVDCANKGGAPNPPWDIPGVHTGEDALALLWDAHDKDASPWAYCPTVLTPSGGVHLYFRDPSGTGPSSARTLAWQVDARGNTGYVVAPGTRLPHGTYTPIYWPATIPIVPDWLLERAVNGGKRPAARRRASPYKVSASPAAIRGILRKVAAAPEGKRNDLLYWAAKTLIEKGAATEDNLEALAYAARHAGLGDTEIRRTIGSAMTTLEAAG